MAVSADLCAVKALWHGPRAAVQHCDSEKKNGGTRGTAVLLFE